MRTGLAAAWFLPGCLLGYAFNWFFIAEPLRRQSLETHALTLPDYLESRFNDPSHVLRVISVIIIFACMMAYMGAQFTAIGKTFLAVFGVPAHVSIPLGGGIIIVYTMMGGFRAVAWTDLAQGLIMVFGLVALSLVALGELGGFGGVVEQVNTADPNALTLMGGKTTAVFFGSMIGLLGIGLGYPGQPHVITRFMAAKNYEVIKAGTWIAMVWGLLIYSSAILLGICGKVLFPGLEDSEQLFPKAAVALLPTALTAVVLTGLLAAIMSTVSSQILVAASAVAHDIFQKIYRGPFSHAKVLRISRATVFVLGMGAMLIALAQTELIFWYVLFAWSGLGASFGPVILFALYTDSVTREGAVAGMLVGFIVTIIWKAAGLSDLIIYELVPAFALSTIAVWSVSKLTASKEDL